MNTPGFWREVCIALLLSVAGSIGYHALAVVAGSGAAARGLMGGLALVYLVVLMSDLHVRVGRFVALAGWLGITLALYAFGAPLWLWLLVQTLLIWLVRCLCLYNGLVGAMTDVALCVFAMAASVAVTIHTQSAFLALWSYFLTHALFVLIPVSRVHASAAVAEDPFDHACRTAEAALRRMHFRS